MADKDKDKEMEAEIARRIKLIFEDEGLDASARRIKQYAREIKDAGEGYELFKLKATKASEAVAGLGRIINQGVSAIDGFGRSFGAAGISAENALKILKDTNTQIIQVSAQYARYGVKISEFTNTMEGMRNKFKLSYAESTKLLSAIENTFNYNKPQAFVTNGLDKVMKAFANNTEAAENFLQAIDNITATRPELEDLVAQGDFAGLEKNINLMVATGQMSVRESKKLRAGFSSMGRVGTGEGAQVDALNERFMAEKTVQKAYEDGLKKTGEQMEALRKTVGLTNERLEKFNDTIANTVLGATWTSTFMKAVSGVADLAQAADGAVKGFKYFKEFMTAARGATTAAEAAEGAATAGELGAGGAAAAGGASLTSAGAILAEVAVAVGGLIAGMKIGRYLTGQSAEVEKSQAIEADFKSQMEAAVDPLKKLELERSMYVQRGATEKIDTWTGGLFGDNEISAETQAKIKELDAKIANFQNTSKSASAASAATGETGQTDQLARQLADQNRINATLKSQMGYAKAMGDIYNKAGNSTKVISINEKIIEDSQKNRAKTMEIIRQQEALLATISDPKQRMDTEKVIAEAKTAQAQALEDESKAMSEIVNSRSSDMALLDKQISLQESQISLLDSAGMGLKAQAGARQQVVQALGQQIAMEKERESKAQALKAKLLQELQGATDDERNKKLAEIRDRENEILDSQQKQVQATQKQADITKSLREGYISAISAMTSGAGVFTRIVLKQDAGMGTLAAMRRDGMNALTTGGIGAGRTEFGRFGAGGFTEGAAGGYETGILNKYGVSASNTLQQNAAAMTGYAQRASSGMSTAMASYGQGPLGSGAFAGAANTGVTTFGGAKGGASQLDVESLRRMMVDIFSRIGQEIINETIRRLRQ